MHERETEAEAIPGILYNSYLKRVLSLNHVATQLEDSILLSAEAHIIALTSLNYESHKMKI